MASRKYNGIATHLTDATLESYFREIRNYKPLSRDEEQALMVRIRSGETAAREQLIKANLRFVVGVSHNYQYQGLPLCDIINEGNVGLITASMHFDETKNFKFISYAVWWIRQSILKALAEQSRIVRLPINRSGDVYHIRKARSILEQRTRRDAEPAEIARELGMKEKAVLEDMAIGETYVSLDAPVNQDGSTALVELMYCKDQESTDTGIEQVFFRKKVTRSLDKLSSREQEVVRMYFGIGTDCAHTLDDIGRHLKLTRERIRQIKEKALAKLRTNMDLERLMGEC